jgi:hypothetical protein
VSISDSDGNHFSLSNPLPVSLEESGGDEIHEFDESTSAIIKGNTDVQSYTVSAGKELSIEQWGISASGYMSAILEVETAAASGTFVEKGKLFNSTANPNASIALKRLIKVPAGAIVRITRCQGDNQSQAMTSFINGIER